VNEAERPDRVFRLGRRSDPWAWPDWTFVGADGTFGNRFDDPEGVFRVLYAATERFGTFVECLANFRPDPAIVAEYDGITGEPDDDEPPLAGVVPREWVGERCMGGGGLEGRFVDIGHHVSLADLRLSLAARAMHHGIHDLDVAAIRLTSPRAFTQEVSRFVFEHSSAGARQWNGIAYLSRFGDDLQNWALFEPDGPIDPVISVFGPDDSDLVAAQDLHGLSLG
jgi:hypothetical protein